MPGIPHAPFSSSLNGAQILLILHHNKKGGHKEPTTSYRYCENKNSCHTLTEKWPCFSQGTEKGFMPIEFNSGSTLRYISSSIWTLRGWPSFSLKILKIIVLLVYEVYCHFFELQGAVQVGKDDSFCNIFYRKIGTQRFFTHHF